MDFFLLHLILRNMYFEIRWITKVNSLEYLSVICLLEILKKSYCLKKNKMSYIFERKEKESENVECKQREQT